MKDKIRDKSCNHCLLRTEPKSTPDVAPLSIRSPGDTHSSTEIAAKEEREDSLRFSCLRTPAAFSPPYGMCAEWVLLFGKELCPCHDCWELQPLSQGTAGKCFSRRDICSRDLQVATPQCPHGDCADPSTSTLALWRRTHCLFSFLCKCDLIY